VNEQHIFIVAEHFNISPLEVSKWDYDLLDKAVSYVAFRQKQQKEANKK